MTNANIAVDFSAEFKRIGRIAANVKGSLDEANIAAMQYADFGLQSGNLDLLRMLREALTHKSLQAKLDSWVKRVLPVKRHSQKLPSGDTLVSYRKDKKRARKEGWQVLDEVAYSTGPMNYKAPKKETEALTLEAILIAVQKGLDRLADKIDDDAGTDALTLRMALEDLANEAEARLDALKPAKPEATQAEIIKAVKDKAVA